MRQRDAEPTLEAEDRPAAAPRRPLLLTIIAAAEELGTGVDFVRDLISRGEVGTVGVGADRTTLRVPYDELVRWAQQGRRYVKAGAAVFYRLKAIEKWIEEQEVDCMPPRPVQQARMTR